MTTYQSNPHLLMNWEEWTRYDATGLAKLVRNKHATPRELACQVAAGIAKVNPSINAVVEVFQDVVDDPLKDGMNPEGPFSGVPFLMKDIGPTVKGRKQELGSLLMQGNIAFEDSFLTTKIRKAGLNIIGRTTTSEMGMHASAENPAVYVSRNPWDLSCTTGGSSAGTGAIVASGALPIAHASDGGGSTRIPAGVNGNIGLKASRGVFSAAPHGSDLVSLTSVSGCMSRSVRDSAAFVDACRGAAAGEFMPYWSPTEPYTKLIQRDPPKLKIALSHEWGDYRATPYIVSELERAGRFLESLGHHVEWYTPRLDFRAAYSVATTYAITGHSAAIERLVTLKGHSRPASPFLEPLSVKAWEDGIKRRSDAQTQIPPIYNQISRGYGEFCEDWDVLLTPVMTQSTPKLGAANLTTLDDNISIDEWCFNFWALYPYMMLANLCGAPGISIPMAMHENGLPSGIHAMSQQACDGLLLSLAAQIERALNGRWNEGRRPTIHVTNP